MPVATGILTYECHNGCKGSGRVGDSIANIEGAAIGMSPTSAVCPNAALTNRDAAHSDPKISNTDSRREDPPMISCK